MKENQHPTLRLALNSLLTLNGIDAVFTTWWIHTGLGTEANPLLSEIVFEPVSFVLAKILLVSLGCYLLWNRATRKLVWVGVGVCVLCYAAVCVYHLAFLAQIV